ncbi:hypothetical protein F0562_033866 [Nyssa sinensis]|uniref:Uncharacterized protein n=1 Tax=Nyssa sinensis TaxID=561372 RepID=A0A5J5AE79_9ASTE|nr:hypothetical protein F0562_033866 [Nyssa sinensis]
MWHTAFILGRAPPFWTHAREKESMSFKERTKGTAVASFRFASFIHISHSFHSQPPLWTKFVGFTGAAGFSLAVLWFVSFGLALLVHHCCGWRINVRGKGSRFSQRICLIMLIVFTCAAAIGCILVSVGQDDFHADMLTEKTNENSGKIRRVFNSVRSALITVAAVMLLLSLPWFCPVYPWASSTQFTYSLLVDGWLLVAVTFVLCGVFVILDRSSRKIFSAYRHQANPCFQLIKVHHEVLGIHSS